MHVYYGDYIVNVLPIAVLWFLKSYALKIYIQMQLLPFGAFEKVSSCNVTLKLRCK